LLDELRATQVVLRAAPELLPPRDFRLNRNQIRAQVRRPVRVYRYAWATLAASLIVLVGVFYLLNSANLAQSPGALAGMSQPTPTPAANNLAAPTLIAAAPTSVPSSPIGRVDATPAANESVSSDTPVMKAQATNLAVMPALPTATVLATLDRRAIPSSAPTLLPSPVPPGFSVQSGVASTQMPLATIAAQKYAGDETQPAADAIMVTATAESAFFMTQAVLPTGTQPTVGPANPLPVTGGGSGTADGSSDNSSPAPAVAPATVTPVPTQTLAPAQTQLPPQTALSTPTLRPQLAAAPTQVATAVMQNQDKDKETMLELLIVFLLTLLRLLFR
jgi:hypothetical protein